MKYSAFYIFILVYLLSVSATSQEDSERFCANGDEKFSQLDGIWYGEFEVQDLNNNYPDNPFLSEQLLVIDGDEVKISIFIDGKWRVYEYDHKLVRHKTNAIIYTHSSTQYWVETYTYTITMNNSNELQVLWQRAVNNFQFPVDNKIARGYYQTNSIFKRVHSVECSQGVCYSTGGNAYPEISKQDNNNEH